jgi:hypothetical protein
MATITSTQSGDFSDTATWTGGVVPTVGDTAVADTGHTVVIDVNTTVDKVTQAGTGKFTLDDGITLTAEVEANAGTFASGGTVEVICGAGETAYIVGNVTGVSSTAVNVCGVNVTGVGTLDLTGSVTGSAGNASSIANGHAAVYTNATCTILIDGAVTAGSNNNKFGVFADSSSNASLTIDGNVLAGSTSGYGVYATGTSPSITVVGNVSGAAAAAAIGVNATGASATVTVTGHVFGGTQPNCHGISASGASATVTVTGDVTAGSGSPAYGVFSAGASGTITITGEVTGGGGTIAYGVFSTGASAMITITGDILGGSGSNAFGAYATGASSLISVVGSATSAGSNGNAVRSAATSSGYGVLFSGDMNDGQAGISACFTQFFRIVDTSPSGVTQYANTASFPTGGTVSRVSPDNVTGMPAEADVRDGLTFGYNSELEGTLAVPPAASVAAGVPVDATVGTAAVRLQDIADVTGAQIAAAITS